MAETGLSCWGDMLVTVTLLRFVGEGIHNHYIDPRGASSELDLRRVTVFVWGCWWFGWTG